MHSTHGAEGRLPAEGAWQRIEQAQREVVRGRRWRTRTLLAAAAVSLGYFAVMGWADHPNPAVENGLIVFPTVAVLCVMELWRRRAAPESRDALRLQYRLAVVYAAAVCCASVLAVALPQPMPAVLAGLLPAGVCLVAADRLRRR